MVSVEMVQRSGNWDMSVRWILKHQTAEQHARLDQIVHNAGCFETLAGYRRWLAAMCDFYAAVSKSLEGHGLPGLDASVRMHERVRRLEADWAALGAAPKTCGCAFTVEVEEPSDAIGMLYVTEGSTLGSRVLVARAHALGCHSGSGAGFLMAEARDRTSWPAILRYLETAEPSEASMKRMIHASRRTFELVEACLDAHHVR